MSATSYAIDLRARVVLAENALGHAADALTVIGADQLPGFDERAYLDQLSIAQAALAEAKRTIMAAVAPCDRVVVLDAG